MQQILDSAISSVRYYIDPGTGSLIIQIAIASLISGLFMLKVFWVRIRQFIGKLFGKHKR